MQGQFCHDCGQELVRPIGFGLLGRVLARETLDLEGRFIRTVIELTRRPDQAIADYLEGHRIALYNPAKYLFLTTTVSILLISFLDIQLLNEQQREVLDPDQARAVDIMIAMSAYLNFLVAFLVAVPQALLSQLGPAQRNLAESFVVQLFIQGHIAIPMIVFIVIFPNLAHLSGLIGMFLLLPYVAWVLVQVHCISVTRAVVQSFALFIVYAFVSILLFAFSQLVGVSWLAGSSSVG
jgi:Protein of unknown function (DUF3667)